jgi:hypothetical protein
MKLRVTSRVQLEIYPNYVIPDYKINYDDEHEDYLSKIIR